MRKKSEAPKLCGYVSHKGKYVCLKLYRQCDPDITSHPKSAAIQNKVCVIQGCIFSIYLAEEQFHVHRQANVPNSQQFNEFYRINTKYMLSMELYISPTHCTFY
jgi:hypothetical protein